MIKVRTLLAVTITLALICTNAFGQEETYTVQVAACEMRDSADSIAADLKTKGYAPYIHEAKDEGGKTWFLVRLEDFSLMDSAKAAAAEFNATTGATAVVTRLSASSPATTPMVAETTAAAAATIAEAPSVPSPASQAVAGEAPEAAPTVAQPTEAAPAVMSVDDKPDTDQRMNELQGELETLQQEMKQLREQQEARRKLEITEDEKSAKEKEILQAAGREYTTMKKNTLGLEYNFNYQYYSYDVITQATSVIEQHANHNLTSSIYTEYAVLDNLTLNLNVPFSYKWDNTGTERFQGSDRPWRCIRWIPVPAPALRRLTAHHHPVRQLYFRHGAQPLRNQYRRGPGPPATGITRPPPVSP